MLASGLLLLGMLFSGLYFFSAQIMARVAIELAGEEGVLLHELSLQRPDLSGVHIDRLAADVGSVHIVAEEVAVSYSFEGLLEKSVDGIEISELQIRVK